MVWERVINLVGWSWRYFARSSGYEAKEHYALFINSISARGSHWECAHIVFK